MKYYKYITLLCIFLSVTNVYASTPLIVDSRIKTYVYNENEVYNLVVNYGYQSSVEFGNGEEVQTISMGDTYAWKITPIGRRIFIKPLEENVNTNMTVITNRRIYHFDVFSKMPDAKLDKHLVYVARFFYPEQNNNAITD
jgi:type IV secretion system protein VirB9